MYKVLGRDVRFPKTYQYMYMLRGVARLGGLVEDHWGQAGVPHVPGFEIVEAMLTLKLKRILYSIEEPGSRKW